MPQEIKGGEILSNLSGKYYINSDFDVNGDLVSANNGTVTIYVNGNVNIEGNAHITRDFMIIANGDINLKGEVNKGILIATGTYE